MSARVERLLSYTLLCMFAVAVLLPLFSIVSVALQPPDSAITGLSWPRHPRWSNFADAWTTGTFGSLLKSSAVVAVVVVPVATVLSVLSGYAFGTMQFPGRSLLFYVMLIGIVMPFEATIVPLYYDLRSLHLTDTYWALILPEVALSVSFGTFWMRAFFLSTPPALIEAARLDGANSFTILWRVLLPIARPAITTLMVLFFVWSWNEFLLALILIQNPDKRTAPAGLGLFVGEHTTNVAGLSAGAVIVTVPVVIVYLFLQRYVIQGMLQGAVKG